jgi:hypothetical protein
MVKISQKFSHLYEVFVRGLCDKSCNHAHSLSKDDSKKFEKFIADCREDAAKKDF